MTTVGVLGGGQLGRMLALAGYPLGLRFRFLDPSPESPAGQLAERVGEPFDNPAALERFRREQTQAVLDRPDPRDDDQAGKA